MYKSRNDLAVGVNGLHFCLLLWSDTVFLWAMRRP